MHTASTDCTPAPVVGLRAVETTGPGTDLGTLRKRPTTGQVTFKRHSGQKCRRDRTAWGDVRIGDFVCYWVGWLFRHCCRAGPSEAFDWAGSAGLSIDLDREDDGRGDRRSSGQTLSGRIGDRKLATDSLCQEVSDFPMAGNGFSVAGLRILPKFVFRALPPQYTAVPAKMPEQSLALHPTTTSSCLASAGRARRDSSRLCSRIRAMAWRRFARHSSGVLPCPLAPGTSAQ